MDFADSKLVALESSATKIHCFGKAPKLVKHSVGSQIEFPLTFMVCLVGKAAMASESC